MTGVSLAEMSEKVSKMEKEKEEDNKASAESFGTVVRAAFANMDNFEDRKKLLSDIKDGKHREIAKGEMDKMNKEDEDKKKAEAMEAEKKDEHEKKAEGMDHKDDDEKMKKAEGQIEQLQTSVNGLERQAVAGIIETMINYRADNGLDTKAIAEKLNNSSPAEIRSMYALEKQLYAVGPGNGLQLVPQQTAFAAQDEPLDMTKVYSNKALASMDYSTQYVKMKAAS